MRIILAIVVAACVIWSNVIGAQAQDAIPLPQPHPLGQDLNHNGDDFVTGDYDEHVYEDTYADCYVGKAARKKHGGRTWTFVEARRVGNTFHVSLTRTEVHKSTNAGSIMTEQLCVITAQTFRVSEKLKLTRRGKLAPAY